MGMNIPGGVAPGAPGTVLPAPQAPGGDVSRGPAPRPLDEIKDLLGMFGVGIPDKNGQGGLFQQRPDINTSLIGGPQPLINTGPVISPQLLQQQVNQTRAGMSSSLAGQQNRLAQNMAASGLGSSPALLAMQNQLGAQNLAGQYQAENQLRLGAAKDNAAQQLQSQTAYAKAVEDAFGNRQREQIERQRIMMSPFQGLLGTIMQSVLQGAV